MATPTSPDCIYVVIEIPRGSRNKYEIDHDSGIGTQFEVADVNRDGRLDIVIANKKGAFYFEQVEAK